jgi:hypothetical protein
MNEGLDATTARRTSVRRHDTTRAGRLADASVDPTEARCAKVEGIVWARLHA